MQSPVIVSLMKIALIVNLTGTALLIFSLDTLMKKMSMIDQEMSGPSQEMVRLPMRTALKCSGLGLPQRTCPEYLMRMTFLIGQEM